VTSDATATVVAALTATVTPSSGGGDEPSVMLAEIPHSELTSSPCALNSQSNGNGIGTAPPPTVGPSSSAGILGDDDPAGRAEYLARAFWIADSLLVWSLEFEDVWEFDLSPEQQAAALMLLEIRTSQLCEAVALLTPTESLEVGYAHFGDAVSARHAWTVLAIERLAGSGSARSVFLSAGRESTHDLVERNQDSLRLLLADSGGNNPLVELGQLGVELTLRAGWYLYGSSRSPVISAPAELLDGLAAEGLFGWETGASVQVRRFGGFGSITTEGAADQFDGLIRSLGDPVSRIDGTLFDSEAVFTTVVDEERGWEFTIVVAVVDKNVYVIDYGCPQAHSGWCDELGDVVNGLSYVGG
jgi:hypothetical protein